MKIITIEQLPVIKQSLNTVKSDIINRIETALSLVCNEKTLAEVKRERALLNKEFSEWESKRKEVKEAIMSPYEQFETVYKNCITEVFKKADNDLKGKINNVETELKSRKLKQLTDYFNEYLCFAETGISIPLRDFVTFEKANINITMSASLKSLKEKVKAYTDRICEDLRLIEIQEHKDEILYEYKQTLNISSAITTVANRYRAIEESKSKAEEYRIKAEAVQKVVEKVKPVIEALTPPETIDTSEEEKILTLKFTVRGTKKKLKELKLYLEREGLYYE